MALARIPDLLRKSLVQGGSTHTPHARCDVHGELPSLWEALVRLLNFIVVGGLMLSASQAYAEDDPAAEIRALKAKLKQLELRVDDQGRKERQIEAQARAIPATAFKAPQEACPDGKVCYKGVTLTFGGWVDLTDIYRTRNLASDTGSVYNFIPFPQAKNYYTPESRFSARHSRFSVLAEG